MIILFIHYTTDIDGKVCRYIGRKGGKGERKRGRERGKSIEIGSEQRDDLTIFKLYRDHENVYIYEYGCHNKIGKICKV